MLNRWRPIVGVVCPFCGFETLEFEFPLEFQVDFHFHCKNCRKEWWDDYAADNDW